MYLRLSHLSWTHALKPRHCPSWDVHLAVRLRHKPVYSSEFRLLWGRLDLVVSCISNTVVLVTHLCPTSCPCSIKQDIGVPSSLRPASFYCLVHGPTKPQKWQNKIDYISKAHVKWPISWLIVVQCSQKTWNEVCMLK